MPALLECTLRPVAAALRSLRPRTARPGPQRLSAAAPVRRAATGASLARSAALIVCTSVPLGLAALPGDPLPLPPPPPPGLPADPGAPLPIWAALPPPGSLFGPPAALGSAGFASGFAATQLARGEERGSGGGRSAELSPPVPPAGRAPAPVRPPAPEERDPFDPDPPGAEPDAFAVPEPALGAALLGLALLTLGARRRAA